MQSFSLPDDALLISNESFMQTKHLCVLIHIWTKGEVGAPLNWFKPSSKIFLFTVPRRCFFCGSFMLFLSCFVMLSRTSVCWCHVVTCWEGLTSYLSFVMSICDFPNGILGQVWCLIVSIPDLFHFLLCFMYLKLFVGVCVCSLFWYAFLCQPFPSRWPQGINKKTWMKA